MQRLFPPPAGDTTLMATYGGARPRTSSGRPWIGLCMVTSIDGSTVHHGASAGLSSQVDRDVLLTLRSIADMVIVGAGTVRSEGYGPPRKAGQRIGVVTRSGNVDVEAPLFSSGAGFLITTEQCRVANVETVRAGDGDVDLVAAVHRLPGSPRFVQAEGGSELNGALAAAGLLDEINITTSPLVVAGDGARATVGQAPLGLAYRLIHLLEDESFLFSRYARR